MAMSPLQAAYAFALRTIYSGRGMPWAVHDETIRIAPDARHLVPHASEPALYEFLRDSVRPGEMVLDVGAFVGIYALLEARWAGARGRVVAFEPTASSAALARRHFGWNSEGERVTLVEAAVSDRESVAQLHTYAAEAMPYSNSLVPAADVQGSGSTERVRVTTIDSVCRELKFKPTLIRMDVQGAEVHAIRGARETIAASPGLRMVVEMHPQCWPAFGVTADDMRRVVLDCGLAMRPLVDGEDLFGRDAHAVLFKP
jgi:FkbM family methyltransferase